MHVVFYQANYLVFAICLVEHYSNVNVDFVDYRRVYIYTQKHESYITINVRCP